MAFKECYIESVYVLKALCIVHKYIMHLSISLSLNISCKWKLVRIIVENILFINLRNILRITWLKRKYWKVIDTQYWKVEWNLAMVCFGSTNILHLNMLLSLLLLTHDFFHVPFFLGEKITRAIYVTFNGKRFIDYFFPFHYK